MDNKARAILIVSTIVLVILSLVLFADTLMHKIYNKSNDPIVTFEQHGNMKYLSFTEDNVLYVIHYATEGEDEDVY